jgi:sigma-E factor negative regulatory protein RseA
MTEEQRQRLSQLVDGEMGTGAAALVLDAVEGDSELRATWERYHLIGQALRHEPINPACRGIAAQMRERIAMEPIPLSTRRPRWVSPPVHVGGAPGRRRWAMGLAAAACGGVAVFMATPLLTNGTVFSLEPAGSSPLAVRESVPLSRVQIENPELASKLDLYLVTHQATAPATGAKGMLPYATLVGYEAPR